MPYACKVLADTISPKGKRITTYQVSYPRFVHAELLTHRMLSRNSSSSRAIPVEKMMKQILEDPAMPVYWGKNKSGMQAAEELAPEELREAQNIWIAAMESAVKSAKKLQEIGLHKQIANRLLEPWMFITVLVTATEWDNFFNLRCHPAAQPELRKIAEMMRDARNASTPRPGKWHLPFSTDDERNVMETLEKMESQELDRLFSQKLEAAETVGDIFSAVDGVLGSPLEEPTPAQKEIEKIILVNVARCARVSYLTHDGQHDPERDVQLAERLMKDGHWSPFEHVAYAMDDPKERCANFFGWLQARADLDPNFIEWSPEE